MRLPYIPNPPAPTTPTEAEIISQTLARRGAEGLIPLDLTLLYSPPITAGWNSFLGAIRTQTSLPADIRELAICRVAVLHQAHFEWTQHAPLALAAGITRVGLRAVLDGTRGDLSERQTAVVDFATESVRETRVGEGVFGRLREHFSDREVVEVVATVAAYCCVSKFLVALDVAEGNGVRVEDYPLPE
ncbi:carboxymuconolactone decarboxylase [Morchella snyderi]|nr:carboxymuconolactone decarboxylase [Morchella snyderi]